MVEYKLLLTLGTWFTPEVHHLPGAGPENLVIWGGSKHALVIMSYRGKGERTTNQYSKRVEVWNRL